MAKKMCIQSFKLNQVIQFYDCEMRFSSPQRDALSRAMSFFPEDGFEDIVELIFSCNEGSGSKEKNAMSVHDHADASLEDCRPGGFA